MQWMIQANSSFFWNSSLAVARVTSSSNLSSLWSLMLFWSNVMVNSSFIHQTFIKSMNSLSKELSVFSNIEWSCLQLAIVEVYVLFLVSFPLHASNVFQCICLLIINWKNIFYCCLSMWKWMPEVVIFRQETEAQ